MNYVDILQAKIVDVETAKRRLAGWRLKSDKLVFTNGCFDILHPGHLTYLAQARSMGNRLIVGVNSDDSVKRLNKGENRPVLSQDARAFDVASLHVVDMVVIFDEDTPLQLISALKPDVLVKGGDYDASVTDKDDKRYIVGSDIVKANGGEVMVLPFVEGYSTTSIIEKMKNG
ncbi:MAG TPA: D-glycero-beta-D-manno-heptose 1-phosphate adenylyltransferase [Flavobacteriales bacterium]|nr:D-glycero-beta-D-manno-heptose 1-phosphate adenylyltransferase [Flavobacteriales bacterium]|tara:strand:+ start:97275 stop:97793 length:519 start_codon:yes stop_codon:yes gene_type:complete